jgi:hypothetical protein
MIESRRVRWVGHVALTGVMRKVGNIKFWSKISEEDTAWDRKAQMGGKPALPLHQSAPSNPTFHLLPTLYKASKNAQSFHIHPEDGNCNF